MPRPTRSKTVQDAQLSRPRTLGELKASPFAAHAGRSVPEELRQNLMAKLRNRERIFPGLLGYDDTVVPQVVNALLSKHHFILLGLRGQAKTRLLRSLADLLDAEVPVIDGLELPDDPLLPVTVEGRARVAELGDDTPIAWLPRDARYIEKLATPDVTVSDLVGDIDPIKAAKLGTQLGDVRAIHYGLLPRANRGIFAINELPDLASKVQVALFNVMQEGDVQIKGYALRMPLDVLLVFSANPEDYTARGKIITPLKDRIGSEIRTHYPRTLEDGMRVTAQEAWVQRPNHVHMPRAVAEAVEAVAFVARDDSRIDKHAGVSQRLPISLLEAVASNAERRALELGGRAVARVSDLYAGLPAITGKLELEYEGELKGGDNIARDLVRRAIAQVFARYADRMDVEAVVAYFEEDQSLRLPDDANAAQRIALARTVPGLMDAAKAVLDGEGDDALVSAIDLVLEGLVAARKVARSEERGYSAPDPAAAAAPARRWN